MTTETVKSTTVANLDAVPVVVNTAGLGGASRVHLVNGSVTATTAKTAPSIYQLLRLRSNAVVKKLRVKLDADVTTFAGDVGCYYSTGVNDGTLPQNSGLVANQTLFGAGVDLHDQVTSVDLADSLSAAQLNMELWQACGLSADPGGFFDICITTVSTNNGGPVVYAEASYVVG